MVKAAFAVWKSRIAPVFDVAQELRVIEEDAGRIVKEEVVYLPKDLSAGKIIAIADRRIEALICGAVSRPLHELILAKGIQVFPFVAGEFSEIVQAWLSNKLDERYAMPGCASRNRRRRGCRAGKTKDRAAAGLSWNCVCPSCGYQEPHTQRIPCRRRACPNCGGLLLRE